VGRPRKPNCLKKNDNFLLVDDTPGGPVCKSGPLVTLPSLRGGVSLEGHTGGFSPTGAGAIHPGICHKWPNTETNLRFEKKIELTA
jgi:hypothetical protein